MDITMRSVGADFLQDIEVTRFNSKKKPESSLLLSFNSETYEVLCTNPKSGKVETSVSLFKVKEIRHGKTFKDFERWAPETKDIENSRCFTIFYGIEFRLNTLSAAAQSKKDAEDWVKGLEYAVLNKPSSYISLIEIWITKQYESLLTPTNNNNQSLSLKQMKDFTNRLNINVSEKELKSKFSEVQNSDGLVSSFGFSAIVRDFLHDQQIFTDCFGKYALGSKIDLNGFEEFLHQEQYEINSSAKYLGYFDEHNKSGSKGIPYMNAQEAVDFLFSKSNQVWNNLFDNVCQDMTYPLSCYWIASSHNTYLTGDQLYSKSSVEAYVRCLRLGCRCIELDCWDGYEGEPVIYHGKTLTTKIAFIDVIRAIKEHAFATSEYPVILSIENHCSIAQQKIMAKKFNEVFGKMLVTAPLSKDEEQLPSPYQLRRRIIIKGKKSPKDAKQIVESTAEKMDLCDTVKTGKMCRREAGRWVPYFFALTNDRLMYTELRDETNGDDEHLEFNAHLSEDLHFRKKWFHGKIPGGLKTAEERVKNFGYEGSFLVRESETRPGEYAICFLSQGEAHHIKIRSNDDRTQYYLLKPEQFESLYSLISYYREHPLDTMTFYMDRLTKAVPQPDTHEQEPWFYPNCRFPEPMNRLKADKILRKIPVNGAYLVRYSSDRTSTGRFVISFRNENRIIHCLVKGDGRLLIVSNKKFESIEKLVSYYQTRAFYKGLKLTHPVEAELYEFARREDILEEDNVYAFTDYLDTSAYSLHQVRALYSYSPADSGMLTFCEGDIITNVVKQDAVWGQGDLEEQIQKTFPLNFVEEMEQVDSPFGELLKGSIVIGRAEVAMREDDLYRFAVRVWCPNSHTPFEAMVDTQEEAEEWKEAINSVNRRMTKASAGNETEKKEKIAQELSKQIVYCCSISKPTQDDTETRDRVYNAISSLNENAAQKQMSVNPRFYLWLHEIQLSRVYPKGQRVDSSNYNPIRYWNFGSQMVALNYQTPDKPMQLNHGKFRQNGKCGYVLRPRYTVGNNFQPGLVSDLSRLEIQPLTLKITVIAVRLLFPPGSRPISSPFVEIEVVGEDFDCQKIKTKKYISGNGFNPFWKEKFAMQVLNPDLALIRFSVSDEDSFGDSSFIGQATYPARCLRPGYRSVPLENGFDEQFLFSSLLIHLQQA